MSSDLLSTAPPDRSQSAYKPFCSTCGAKCAKGRFCPSCGAEKISAEENAPADLPSVRESVSGSIGSRRGLQISEEDFVANLFAEINVARTQPLVYAEYLSALLPCFRGSELQIPGESLTVVTKEGSAAVEQAVQFLRTVSSVPALVRLSRGMCSAAQLHVQDAGSHGIIGHKSSDGTPISGRLDRFGEWKTCCAESIFYGTPRSARRVVEVWLVDDGVPERRNRANLFMDRFCVAGLALGPHASRKFMVVADFAHSFIDRPVTVSSSFVLERSAPTQPAVDPASRIQTSPQQNENIDSPQAQSSKPNPDTGPEAAARAPSSSKAPAQLSRESVVSPSVHTSSEASAQVELPREEPATTLSIRAVRANANPSPPLTDPQIPPTETTTHQSLRASCSKPSVLKSQPPDSRKNSQIANDCDVHASQSGLPGMGVGRPTLSPSPSATLITTITTIIAATSTCTTAIRESIVVTTPSISPENQQRTVSPPVPSSVTVTPVYSQSLPPAAANNSAPTSNTDTVQAAAVAPAALSISVSAPPRSLAVDATAAATSTRPTPLATTTTATASTAAGTAEQAPPPTALSPDNTVVVPPAPLQSTQQQQPQQPTQTAEAQAQEPQPPAGVSKRKQGIAWTPPCLASPEQPLRDAPPLSRHPSRDKSSPKRLSARVAPVVADGGDDADTYLFPVHTVASDSPRVASSTSTTLSPTQPSTAPVISSATTNRSTSPTPAHLARGNTSPSRPKLTSRRTGAGVASSDVALASGPMSPTLKGARLANKHPSKQVRGVAQLGPNNRSVRSSLAAKYHVISEPDLGGGGSNSGSDNDEPEDPDDPPFRVIRERPHHPLEGGPPSGSFNATRLSGGPLRPSLRPNSSSGGGGSARDGAASDTQQISGVSAGKLPMTRNSLRNQQLSPRPSSPQSQPPPQPTPSSNGPRGAMAPSGNSSFNSNISHSSAGGGSAGGGVPLRSALRPASAPAPPAVPNPTNLRSCLASRGSSGPSVDGGGGGDDTPRSRSPRTVRWTEDTNDELDYVEVNTADDCGHCHQMLGERELVRVLGQVWHLDCFVCQRCEAPFPSMRFCIVRNQPYCAMCATIRAQDALAARKKRLAKGPSSPNLPASANRPAFARTNVTRKSAPVGTGAPRPTSLRRV
eukprot:gnl/Spiro4/16566_TR8918_c0_g1_i1.p1 gnl/Spiro4/16566_TR8918_c0_g1~~gnl/Spiro4/16566_TR8918_c0_g1_i1.p1  ORF type:complete len:1145 (-),score=162.18 gnl/Spiro4/16566_TR8918_c0_g1_i1:40-3474(-)